MCESISMSKVKISKAAADLEELTEEERRALRISRFHAEQLQPPTSTAARPPARLAHPGGALATNKAAALAKFLQRKLNEPGGAATLDPDLVERAVENAKATAIGGQQPTASSKAARRIRHVDSFSDSDEDGVAHRELSGEQHVRVKKQKKKIKAPVKNSRIDKISKKKKKSKQEKKNKKS